MDDNLKVMAADGAGFMDVFIARPDDGAPAGALIVIQEIFGVNANMRDLCRGFARAGYLALCPDLFWRQQPGVQLTDASDAEWKQAFALMQGMDGDKAMEDLKSTLNAARNDPQCTGKVGAVGYCMGGRLAAQLAACSTLDGAVSYYGVGLEATAEDLSRVSCPLLLHIAELDKYVPPAAREKILQAVAANPSVTAEVYAGVDHAFARIGGAHYDAGAAAQANTRTADFLAAHVGGGDWT